MGLLGPYQDVLTPKEFVPGGVQLTQKLEPFLSTDQRLLSVSVKVALKRMRFFNHELQRYGSIWKTSVHAC